MSSKTRSNLSNVLSDQHRHKAITQTKTTLDIILGSTSAQRQRIYKHRCAPSVPHIAVKPNKTCLLYEVTSHNNNLNITSTITSIIIIINWNKYEFNYSINRRFVSKYYTYYSSNHYTYSLRTPCLTLTLECLCRYTLYLELDHTRRSGDQSFVAALNVKSTSPTTLCIIQVHNLFTNNLDIILYKLSMRDVCRYSFN